MQLKIICTSKFCNQTQQPDKERFQMLLLELLCEKRFGEGGGLGGDDNFQAESSNLLPSFRGGPEQA